jgi:hypothetical protein
LPRIFRAKYFALKPAVHVKADDLTVLNHHIAVVAELINRAW